MSSSGLLSGPPLYRYVPGVGKVASVQVGPTGPQGIAGVAANTGATGPTGPGAGLIPSSFTTATGSVTLSTGPTGTQLANTTITTTQTGYIWATTSVELVNQDNSAAHDVTVYQVVNGFTSDGMMTSLQKKSNSGTYQSVTLSYRTNTQIGPGTYPVQAYAYTGDTTTQVTAVHRDTFGIGHLG